MGNRRRPVRAFGCAVTCALVTCFFSTNLRAEDFTTLKVMSFNIRGAAYGIDPVDSWIYVNFANPSDPLAGPHRRDRAIAVIRDNMPDIMGVEELKQIQQDDLLAAFPEFAYFGEGREGNGMGDSNGIFYNTSRFNLIDGGSFWLSDTPDIPDTTFTGYGTDTGNPRMATWAILHDLASGQDFFILNTHWSLDSLARSESAALIQSMLPSIDRGLPMLVMGDLNTTASSSAYKTLRGLNSSTDTDLRDAFVDGGGVDGRTYHAYNGGVSGSRIDQVLYAGDIFTPTSAQIIRTTYDNGLYPSDHYPVTVTFNIAVIPELGTLTLSGAGALIMIGVLIRRRP